MDDLPFLATVRFWLCVDRLNQQPIPVSRGKGLH